MSARSMWSLSSAVLSSGAAAARRGTRLRGASVAVLGSQRRWLQMATKNSEVVFDIKGESIDGRSTFLDNQSTTAMDPRVLDAMMPLMTWQYGNPHSRSHHYGWEAEEAVEVARGHVGTLIGADAKEIIFTSGATECNNMAIKGVARFYGAKKKHIITTQTEHKCVLDSCRVLQGEGFDITYLPVKSNGLIDLEVLKKEIRPDTVLVSVMAVNNEIGVIQPMEEIGKICRANKVFFHSDIAQAAGKIEVDVNKWNLDLASISGHKIYGPKGVGALFIRRRPRVRIEPVLSGGGQERGLRSGTVPSALSVGIGEAARLCLLERERDYAHSKRLASKMFAAIQRRVPNVTLNGDPHARVPGNLNLSFAYVEGESLLMALKEVAVSSGSACTSASLEPSYVLRALGVDEDMAHTSIRFGVGRFTTEEEVDHAIELVVSAPTPPPPPPLAPVPFSLAPPTLLTWWPRPCWHEGRCGNT
jgi:cysteine desulfurase